MSASPPRPGEPVELEAGLCAACRHARVQNSGRGSSFWRCARADARGGVPKYPRLPVLVCELQEDGTPTPG